VACWPQRFWADELPEHAMEVLHFLLGVLGSKGIPFVTASATYGVFRLLEGHASREAKLALTHWLLSLDLRKADSLPQGVQDIFNRIFGVNHFSFICFRRSVYYSIAAVLFTTLIYALLHPDSAFRTEQPEFQSLFYKIAGTWIFVSIFYDYLNLWKTRIILGFLAAKVRNKAAVLSVVILDPLLGYVLFAAIFSMFGLLVAVLSYPDRTAEFLAEARTYPEHDLRLMLPVIQWRKNVSPLF
jgi:hypothetical protein